MKPKVILTGAPGFNKTALVQQILDRLPDAKTAGFITVEQRDKKGRGGYTMQTLDGKEIPFATQGKGRGARVGKYLVDVEAFEEAALKAIGFQSGVELYVIDEINPMGTLSRTFCETAKMLLKSDKVAVLATVARTGHGFIREVKRLPGADTFDVNDENSMQVEEEVVARLKGSVS